MLFATERAGLVITAILGGVIESLPFKASPKHYKSMIWDMIKTKKRLIFVDGDHSMVSGRCRIRFTVSCFPLRILVRLYTSTFFKSLSRPSVTMLCR